MGEGEVQVQGPAYMSGVSPEHLGDQGGVHVLLHKGEGNQFPCKTVSLKMRPKETGSRVFSTLLLLFSKTCSISALGNVISSNLNFLRLQSFRR